MEIKRSIIFNKINVGNELTIDKICSELNKKSYNEKVGIGVLNVLNEENIIHIEILVRTPTYISNYDQSLKSISRNVINIYDEVSIDIDLMNGILYSTSSSARLNKAKSFLRSIFSQQMSFGNIFFTNEKIRGWLDKDGYSYSIMNMTIRMFKYNEGAFGRFTANIISQETGERLIDEYKEEVRNIVMKVETSSTSPFILQYAMQNTIILKCEEADYWTIIDFIKRNI